MMSRMSRVVLVLAVLSLSSLATAQTNLARPAKMDVVVDWNAITMTVVSVQNGAEQVRLAAITHLAVFEAVNAIIGEFEPYLGKVAAPAGASAEAAAVAAAHAVLRHYVPDQAGPLDAARASSLAGIPDGPGKDRGITVGDAAATALILHRLNDGSQPAEFFTPQSSDPGQWQPTPGCTPEGGLFLHWRNVTPFGIPQADQFRLHPPPPLTSHRFARDYNETKAVGGVDSQERPADRANVARFFAAVPSQVAWNSIARQIATAWRLSLSDNARLFALLNMAMNDSLVAAIETKYHYTFWRPETAIHAGDTDGNPATEADPGFKPFVTAPCFPSYPSTIAASSYAAREIVERIFRDRRHFIELSTPALPDIVLRYTRLDQITSDIDDARIYGGIHYRSDQQAGARQGRKVGEYVVAHNLRRPRHRTEHSRRD